MTKYSNSLQASNLEVKESLENLGQKTTSKSYRFVSLWAGQSKILQLVFFALKIPIGPLRLVARLLVLESLPMHFGSLVKLTL